MGTRRNVTFSGNTANVELQHEEDFYKKQFKSQMSELEKINNKVSKALNIIEQKGLLNNNELKDCLDSIKRCDKYIKDIEEVKSVVSHIQTDKGTYYRVLNRVLNMIVENKRRLEILRDNYLAKSDSGGLVQ